VHRAEAARVSADLLDPVDERETARGTAVALRVSSQKPNMHWLIGLKQLWHAGSGEHDDAHPSGGPARQAL
jgi:hypothetical protein